MTPEQAIKRIQDKQSQIRQLNQEIEQTKSELKSLTPLKVGQKVSVATTRGKIACFISDVEYTGYGKEKWEYKFCKVKKDGTMGGQSAGIYGYTSVEPIS